MEKWKKKAKIQRGILIFFYTIPMAILQVHTNLKTLAQIGAEKSVIEFFAREKEKWPKKRD